MTYPLSTNVSAGDPTLSAHYNNLRSDAVLLGQPAADVINLASLLERYESRLTIQRLSTDELRVPASAAEPVSLIIAGYMVQAVANVDLAAGTKPAGVAADYYIFANRTAGSTTFTLSVATSLTEGANQRRIGRFYWDGVAIVKDSVRTEQAVFIKSLLYFVEPHTCEGRLTLSTGNPIPTGDVSSSGTLYFTPHLGDRVALYANSYGWRLYAFAELSLDLAGVATDKNLDIWVYDNAGTLTLDYTLWSNDILRATALARQDGVLVKSGAPAYRYLGTIRTSNIGVTCDTVLKRFVWNYFNRVERCLLVTDTTDSWTYTTLQTWRSLNNSLNNRVNFVIGIDQVFVKFSVNVLAEDSGSGGVGVGICLDAVNNNSAQIKRGIKGLGADYNLGWYGAEYIASPGIGYHFLQLVEWMGTTGHTATFYGDKGAPDEVQSGGIGFISC